MFHTLKYKRLTITNQRLDEDFSAHKEMAAAFPYYLKVFFSVSRTFKLGISFKHLSLNMKGWWTN